LLQKLIRRLTLQSNNTKALRSDSYIFLPPKLAALRAAGQCKTKAGCKSYNGSARPAGRPVAGPLYSMLLEQSAAKKYNYPRSVERVCFTTLIHQKRWLGLYAGQSNAHCPLAVYPAGLPPFAVALPAPSGRPSPFFLPACSSGRQPHMLPVRPSGRRQRLLRSVPPPLPTRCHPLAPTNPATLSKGFLPFNPKFCET
jgi:hypothetical protein